MFDDLFTKEQISRQPFDAEIKVWNAIFPKGGHELNADDPHFHDMVSQSLRLDTFARLTKNWSAGSFDSLLRRISEPPSDPTSTISSNLAFRRMTQLSISLRSAVLLMYGIDPKFPKSKMPGRVQIELMLLQEQASWLLSEDGEDPVYNLAYGAISCIDELIRLRASNNEFVCPTVRDCWLKLRDLNMNVRELGPFGQYEVLCALGIEQQQLASRDEGENSSDNIQTLKAKIKSLEDSSPLVRVSLEKMVLAMAINQYGYDPGATRNNSLSARLIYWV